MFFRVLGPVEVYQGESQHPVGPLKVRHVLAILLLEAGRTISAQSLAERLWDEERVPDKWRETVQVYVSRLRASLRAAGGRSGLITNSFAGGYRLDVSPDQVDVRRFEQLLTAARAATAALNPQRARELLREAEGLWRGQPFEGLAGGWIDATRRALLERRRGAIIARIGLDLRLGDNSDEIISELTALTVTGRIDQGAVGLLMRALYDVGRQDEALAAYRRARTRLRDELGIEPRPELSALHQQILRGDPDLTPAAQTQPGSGGPAPDTLDLDPSYLTGRDTELRDLVAGVTDDLRSGSGIAVYALDGMPGIGKSTLAVRAAHLLRAHCPDGLLQINLRTHHPHQPPLDPREALTQLLDAIATPSAELGRADSLDALAALWRRRSSGRRLLIVFDDVLDAEQVAALMPTTPGSIVLLTSRRRLFGPADARHHTVRLLSDDAVRALLVRITGREFPAQDPDVELFIRHCGGLPLAATVAAAYLRARPAWTLGDLVARLAATPRVPADDRLAGPLCAAFAMSYNALDGPHRTLLRRLAAHPGHEIGVYAAAVLADLEPQAVDLALDALVEHHLLEEIGRHRYRLHDLLRVYALGRIRHERDSLETDAAIVRMIECHVAAAARAERIVHPHRRIIEQPALKPPWDTLPLETPAQATAWLDKESENLAAIAAYAWEQRLLRPAILLPHFLTQYLDRRGHWRQAVEMLRRALDAATSEQLDDVSAGPLAAQLMTDLAAASVRIGELARARDLAQQALDAWSACGDERGQADALLELGRIHWYARRAQAAIDAYEGSASLYRWIGGSRGLAVAEYHLGIIRFELGAHEEALMHTRRTLETARTLGDRALECDALTDLGEMYRLTNRPDQALAYFREAEPLAAELGDPHNRAVLANNLGAVYDHIGDHEAALFSFRTALRLFQALGDRRNEIDTLVNLADALTRVGDASALGELRRAAALAAQIDDPLRFARIHLATGHVHRSHGRHADALDSYHAALAHAREATAPLDEAHALRALGDTLSAVGEHDSARQHWDQARGHYLRLGHPDAGLIPDNDNRG